MSAGLTEQGKALGEPTAFKWDGKSWQIGPIDFDTEMRFAAALQAKAEEGLRRGAASMGQAVYQDAVRQHLDDIACSEFDWSGRVGTAARYSVGGSAELLFLAIAKNHKDFTRDDLRRLVKDSAKLLEAFDIVRRLTEPPPNGQGPAAP